MNDKIEKQNRLLTQQAEQKREIYNQKGESLELRQKILDRIQYKHPDDPYWKEFKKDYFDRKIDPVEDYYTPETMKLSLNEKIALKAKIMIKTFVEWREKKSSYDKKVLLENRIKYLREQKRIKASKYDKALKPLERIKNYEMKKDRQTKLKELLDIYKLDKIRRDSPFFDEKLEKIKQKLKDQDLVRKHLQEKLDKEKKLNASAEKVKALQDQISKLDKEIADLKKYKEYKKVSEDKQEEYSTLRSKSLLPMLFNVYGDSKKYLERNYFLDNEERLREKAQELKQK